MKFAERAGLERPAVGQASVATDVHWLKENLHIDGKALKLHCGDGFVTL